MIQVQEVEYSVQSGVEKVPSKCSHSIDWNDCM